MEDKSWTLRSATRMMTANTLSIELGYIESRLKSRSRESLKTRSQDRYKRFVVKRFIRELDERETDRKSMDYLMEQVEEGRREYEETGDSELYYRVILAKRCLEEMVRYI